MLQILSMVFGIGSLACWIFTLVEMFRRAGVLQGIIGIICGLWAFIWGWMHVSETNQNKLMLAWTVCIIGSVAVTAMGGGFDPSAT